MVCFFVESILTYTYINNIKVKNIEISFINIELLLIVTLFWKQLDLYFKKVLLIILLFFLVLFGLKILNIYQVNINIFFGGSKIVILLISLIALFNSVSNKISNWKLLLAYSFLQYSLVGIVISSFASFFIMYPEYNYFYNLTNSVNNFMFYCLITLSMIRCKKIFSIV